MNKYTLIVTIVYLLLSSCIKDSSTVIFYSKYNTKDQLISKNLFEIKRDHLMELDSITVFNNKSIVCSFKEKVVNNQGVFRSCDNSLSLTHSFLDTLSTFKYCTSKQPFLNTQAQLIGSKAYFVLGKSYKIYHYSEDDGAHSAYNSYYIQGIGFICIYNFDRNEYILGDSTNIKSIPLKDITKALVSDTSFFAKYTLPKLFPNYYRGKPE